MRSCLQKSQQAGKWKTGSYFMLKSHTISIYVTEKTIKHPMQGVQTQV